MVSSKKRESEPKTFSWDFYRKLYWLFSKWIDYIADLLKGAQRETP